MSNWEFAFVIGFLLIQLLLPARRYLYALVYRKEVSQVIPYFWFSWTMRSTLVEGTGRLRVFDKATGKTRSIIRLEDRLPQHQLALLCKDPQSILYLIPKIEAKLREEGEENFGLGFYLVTQRNRGKPMEITDPEVDLIGKSFVWFGRQKWDLSR